MRNGWQISKNRADPGCTPNPSGSLWEATLPKSYFSPMTGFSSQMLSPMTLSTMSEWNSPPLALYSAKALVNILVCMVMWIYFFLTFLCDSDVYMHAQSFQLCPILCDPVDCSLLLSMGFSRQKYWSGLPFPSSGDLPNPGIDPASILCLPHWQVVLCP